MDAQSLAEAIAAHFQRIEETAVKMAKVAAVPEEGQPKADETMADADALGMTPCAEAQTVGLLKEAVDDPMPEAPMAPAGGQPEDKLAYAYTWEQTTHRYSVDDGFHKDDLYWKTNVREGRFESALTSGKGILYRPQIVTELHQMIDSALSNEVRRGIMVKGPAGIGKSHSLVNLVRRLMYGSNSEYLVTFIPDCFKWYSVVELLDAICASCGIAAEPFLKQVKGNNVLDGLLLNNLITSIDGILCSKGKRWIFVFDHINKLFVKRENIHAQDASGLSFPFHCIKSIMKPKRITSVISASANNEMAYKESHEGFSEYFHTPEMTGPELLQLFDNIDRSSVVTVLEETSGVPMFAASYVDKNMEIDPYELEVIASVRHSLEKLENETSDTNWNRVVASTISALLLTETRESLYDKKFLLPEQIQMQRRFLYKPLVPQVSTAYREHFWSKLMLYVETKERALLNVCRDPATTNKVRGCCFETMVIRRCSANDVEFQVGGMSVTVPSGDQEATGFGGNLLPEAPSDGLSFPFNPNFPAIDFILKVGRYVFAIQVHVNKHNDESSDFAGLCRQAGWFEKFNWIELIYLSPEEDVTNLVESRVMPPTFNVRPTQQERATGQPCRQIRRRALSKDAIACLRDLQWPDNCSINSS